MKRSNGFLLIDVLIAVAILATALLAVSEALSTARNAGKRTNALQAIAACADQKLSMTLMGPRAPDLGCDPTIRVEMESSLPGGDVEQVTWVFVTAEGSTEKFTAVRYAR